MKKQTLFSLLLLIPLTHLLAESGLSPQDMQNIQMLRAQQEMKQQEEDWKNPVKVSQGDRAVMGVKEAPISIIAYSDFQCPYCKNGAEAVHSVMKKYGKKVNFQFRHFPLGFHPYAMPAAKRFEALGLQGASLAYKFHDAVFENQERLAKEGEKFLDEMAKKVGGNLEKMKKEMESEKVISRINTDMAEATKLGISGTPAFIVAGVRLFGAYPASEFSKIIDRRLKVKN